MGMLRLGAAAVSAVVGLLAAVLGGPPSTSAPMSPFGGSVAVHIAHVGRIEVDLGPRHAGGLRRVGCAAAPVGTACYIAR